MEKCNVPLTEAADFKLCGECNERIGEGQKRRVDEAITKWCRSDRRPFTYSATTFCPRGHLVSVYNGRRIESNPFVIDQ